MKKKITGFLAGFLGFLAFLVLVGIVGSYETHYYMEGSVIRSNDGNITIEIDGNLYDYKSTEFHTGENVKLLMFTNGTDTEFADDVIEEVIRR